MTDKNKQKLFDSVHIDTCPDVEVELSAGVGGLKEGKWQGKLWEVSDAAEGSEAGELEVELTAFGVGHDAENPTAWEDFSVDLL